MFYQIRRSFCFIFLLISCLFSFLNPKLRLFGKYPNSIFSKSEQKELFDRNGEINKELLQIKLQKINDNETIKILIRSKSQSCFEPFNFYGHSLLLKKIGNDEFTLFDPNTGEARYSFQGLVEELHKLKEHHSGHDLVFISGKEYLDILESKGIINKS